MKLKITSGYEMIIQCRIQKQFVLYRGVNRYCPQGGLNSGTIVSNYRKSITRSQFFFVDR